MSKTAGQKEYDGHEVIAFKVTSQNEAVCSNMWICSTYIIHKNIFFIFFMRFFFLTTKTWCRAVFLNPILGDPHYCAFCNSFKD